MKIKQSSWFLAIVLATAGPAFADTIDADSKVGDRGFAPTSLYSHKATLHNDSLTRNSNKRTFREGKVVREANDEVQIRNFMEEGNNFQTGVPLGFGVDSVDHNEGLAEFGSKHGNPFGWNDEGGKKHGDKDWDDDDARESVVAIPEPGTI